MSNLKTAPLSLTPDVAAKLLGDQPGYGKRIKRVPIEPVKLVDRPRRSENPALARANDDEARPAPYELRRIRLERAIAHLKRQCILVSVVNRDAQIRTYRVSGKREPMLAEDVIAHAIAKGMEAQG